MLEAAHECVTHECKALVQGDRKVLPLVIAFIVLELSGVLWDLPGAYGWENDGAAPRDLFGGIGNNLTPGQGHRYPLLHYLLLGLLVTPVLLLDVVVAGLVGAPLEETVVSVASMTAIALVSKVLNVAMMALTLLALARVFRTCFSPIAGRWAVLFAATNLTVAYYGRVTNMDGPYLMWTVLAIDRLLLLVSSAQRRDYALFAIFVAASMATKDQAYATYVFVGPLYLLLLPALDSSFIAAGRRHWSQLLRAVGIGVLSYAVLSGALFNPSGFLQRLATLTGENSQDWKTYESSALGWWQNARHILEHQNDYWWPWPVVLVTWLGVLFSINGISGALLAHPGRQPLALRLLPLCAGISSTIAFTLVVGRDAHRFVLPLGFWLSGYAGVAIAALLGVSKLAWLRSLSFAGASALVGLALSYNLELLITQWCDSRRAVEDYLSRLPHGTHVETYGLGVYLPRFNLSAESNYKVTHIRADSRKRPPLLVGLNTAVDSYARVNLRKPDVLVIPEAFGERFLPRPTAEHRTEQKAIEQYTRAAGALEFFPRAAANELPGYKRLGVGTVSLPGWYRRLGGRAIRMHGSTGQAVWVLLRDRAPSSGT